MAAALEHISQSAGLKYLLVGSYLAPGLSNADVADGDVFDINLLSEPFNLPQPLDVFQEANTHAGQPQHDKSLLLFAAADLRAVSWADMRVRVQAFKRLLPGQWNAAPSPPR